jgi:hypothetical protein
MPGMSEVQKDTDGTGVTNESHHQTMTFQRVGHGHDRQNQPSVQQWSPIHFGHHGLFHQMGGGHPYEVSNIEGYYQFYQRACYSQVWNSSDHHDRWMIGLHIQGVQEVHR